MEPNPDPLNNGSPSLLPPSGQDVDEEIAALTRKLAGEIDTTISAYAPEKVAKFTENKVGTEVKAPSTVKTDTSKVSPNRDVPSLILINEEPPKIVDQVINPVVEIDVNEPLHNVDVPPLQSSPLGRVEALMPEVKLSTATGAIPLNQTTKEVVSSSNASTTSAHDASPTAPEVEDSHFEKTVLGEISPPDTVFAKTKVTPITPPLATAARLTYKKKSWWKVGKVLHGAFSNAVARLKGKNPISENNDAQALKIMDEEHNEVVTGKMELEIKENVKELIGAVAQTSPDVSTVAQSTTEQLVNSANTPMIHTVLPNERLWDIVKDHLFAIDESDAFKNLTLEKKNLKISQYVAFIKENGLIPGVTDINVGDVIDFQKIDAAMSAVTSSK